jgi:hypothetical protein
MNQTIPLRIRYFFDAGSGVCLWAGNDEARQRHGYAIDAQALPLTDDTRGWLSHLIAWHDTRLDWDDPGGDSPWPDDERPRFQRAAQEGLARLRRELPAPHFEIIDESR